MTTADDGKCEHCGNLRATHQGRCPRIKAIEYYENGTIKRIEYLTPSDLMAPVSQALVAPYLPAPLPFPGPTWGGTYTGAMRQ